MESEPYPWQLQVVDIIKGQPCVRTVHCIVDPNGSAGKSTLCDYLQYMDLGKALVPMASMEDLMQAVFNIGKRRCYLMDMPKGTPKDKLGPLYAGIEKIKDGTAYDKRYAYKELHMMEPHFFVFTNKWPQLSLLSPDRWKLYAIINHRLVGCVPPSTHVQVDVEKWVKAQCQDVVLTTLPVPTEPLLWTHPAPVPVPATVPGAAAAQPVSSSSSSSAGAAAAQPVSSSSSSSAVAAAPVPSPATPQHRPNRPGAPPPPPPTPPGVGGRVPPPPTTESPAAKRKREVEEAYRMAVDDWSGDELPCTPSRQCLGFRSFSVAGNRRIQPRAELELDSDNEEPRESEIESGSSRAMSSDRDSDRDSDSVRDSDSDSDSGSD